MILFIYMAHGFMRALFNRLPSQSAGSVNANFEMVGVGFCIGLRPHIDYDSVAFIIFGLPLH